MDGSILAIVSEKSIPFFKVFDERQKRLWAVAEALPLGRGGITAELKRMGYSIGVTTVRKLLKCRESESVKNLPHPIILREYRVFSLFFMRLHC